MNKMLPIYCPSCHQNLKVQALVCAQCDTTVNGLYDMHMLLQLNTDQQKFIIDFVKSSGSLKDMASKLGLSYPTVRNMLDAIIQDIGKIENPPKDEL